MGIVFDIYGGTHQPGYVKTHEKLSQDLFLKIFEKGFFTKRKTKQLYDAQAEQFLPARFVRGKCPPCASDMAFGDPCEGCGRGGSDRSTVRGSETLKVAEGNRAEIEGMCQDAREEAVLMGCAEIQVRDVLRALADSLDKPFAD